MVTALPLVAAAVQLLLMVRIGRTVAVLAASRRYSHTAQTIGHRHEGD